MNIFDIHISKYYGFNSTVSEKKHILNKSITNALVIRACSKYTYNKYQYLIFGFVFCFKHVSFLSSSCL